MSDDSFLTHDEDSNDDENGDKTVFDDIIKENLQESHNFSESESQENSHSDDEKDCNKRKAESSSQDRKRTKQSLDDAIPKSADPFTCHFDTPPLSSFETFGEIPLQKKSVTWEILGNLVLSGRIEEHLQNLKKLPEEDLHLNKIVSTNVKECVLASCGSTKLELSDFQKELLSIIGTYRDFSYTERSFENAEEIRIAYTLHALNHVLKTKSRIIHHNAKLSKGEGSGEFRDQGFTRPKVLILLPFRHSALRVVKYLIALLFGYKNDESEAKRNVMNAKKFSEEFDADNVPSYTDKPEDYKKIFAGNTDDAFRIGIAVTKKSLKLYSDFYTSDIIIASPLGLRTIIGAKGDKERDYDFLSSIEIVVMDQAECFLMQNWEHVAHIFKHLNLQPCEPHGCDFSRVRMWALDGLYKYYNQKIVISSVNSMVINALFNKESHNYRGQVCVRNPVASGSDVIQQVIVQCPQRFHRFSCSSITNLPDERFKYFVSKVLPLYKDASMSHTMVYIPSYFDFVRIRNYFRKEELNFTQVCEYTKEGKIAQARSLFFHGGRHILLYTERAHFYHRYRIKGIRHLIFYELPTFPHFYSELSNLLHPNYQGKKFTGDESSMSVVALYCKYDFPSLSAVVGTNRAELLLKSATDTHLFVTENKAD